eukprot:jgi/Bigna1/126575/aug1.2_g1283
MVDVDGPFRDEDENSFWRRRIDAMRKAMLSLPPDTLVLVLDSLDVLFLKGPETLLGEYKKMNKKVVYGAEMLCDTASCRTNSSLKNFLLSRAPKPSNAAKFLNAGNVIGKAGDLATIYQKVTSMMRIMDVDDQTALGSSSSSSIKVLLLETYIITREKRFMISENNNNNNNNID